MLTIGVVAYGQRPAEIMPPGRLRAMFAEAALQSARLVLFSDGLAAPGQAQIEADAWVGSGPQRCRTGLPDVVIALNAPRRQAESAVAAWLSRTVPVISDQAPDKLGLAALLSASDLARHVIPSARLSPDTMHDMIATWLARHAACVVKAANGQRGSGVYFLHAAADGGYELHKDAEVMRADATGVVAAVCKRIGGRMAYRPFLVQRYIASLSADGRAVDCRVHVQRDGAGAWGVTRAYIRLAEAGMLVSNVSRGGYQGQLMPFLAQRRARPAQAIADEIRTLSLAVAATIERHENRELSELGVDIALDAQDALWLIEANARPESSQHEHERAAGMIAYALHVARRYAS